MSPEDPGEGLDATLREFASGQKLFSRYTLIKTLGRGGMGVVWLARDEELERDVALKFLPDLIVRDRAFLSDMKRETRRSLELTHKNIVRIHDFIYDAQSGCISMEYIDGDTLSNLRVDRPQKVFEPHELVGWTTQLCDALDYAHNHARIIHRDLKPSNLMVNGRGELKVADFGIARSLNESVSMLTMQQGRSGTLLYMSPQQLDGERGSHLDDIYSVGASLYELITSKPPFYFGNIDRQIREKTPPRMTVRRQELEIEGPPVNAIWEDLVRACLDKNPERRPQSVTEIAERLDTSSPKTRKMRRSLPQRRQGMLAALGGLAAMAALAAWYFSIHQSRSNSRIAGSPRPAIEMPAPSVATTVSESPANTIVATAPTAAAEAQRPTPLPEPSSPSAPKLPASAGSTYFGTIHVRNDNSVNVPLTVNLGPDARTGTMTQSGRRGDVVVKFTGVWDKNILRAVTDQVVAAPTGVTWEPEAFTLRFGDDSNSAVYECIAGGKTYFADLELQRGAAAKLSLNYQGMISSDGDSHLTPITIDFAPNRRSGTMTQMSTSGSTVVKFDGVWDGDTLRAVTNDVVSKPKNIQWKAESFVLRFTEDTKELNYECRSDGRLYTAVLAPR